MMPLEFAPPKYAIVVNAVQERIQDGTYPPGSAIPSETTLMAEFKISRPTIVRALNILAQDGWIDSEHGRGRYVRARSLMATHRAPEHAAGMLDQGETAGVKVLKVGPILAPNRAASALGIDPETPVIARQRLVVTDIGPVELATVYVPVELTIGTDISASNPIEEGMLAHLVDRKGVDFDYAAERISARLASNDEAALLEIGRREPVLTVLVTAFDRSGKAIFVVDVVIPPTRQDLEDVFPLG